MTPLMWDQEWDDLYSSLKKVSLISFFELPKAQGCHLHGRIWHDHQHACMLGCLQVLFRAGMPHLLESCAIGWLQAGCWERQADHEVYLSHYQSSTCFHVVAEAGCWLELSQPPVSVSPLFVWQVQPLLFSSLWLQFQTISNYVSTVVTWWIKWLAQGDPESTFDFADSCKVPRIANSTGFILEQSLCNWVEIALIIDWLTYAIEIQKLPVAHHWS